MNIYLENVNLNLNSGPNYFAQKLVKYLSMKGVTFSNEMKPDICLAFIESRNNTNVPLVQRLDGIYFNANFNCEMMNSNIKKTYEKANGVVFQTKFNKDLVFNWFGEHSNYKIINNGYDKLSLNTFKRNKELEIQFSQYDTVWSCAASWHSYKRLEDNINYFLENAGPNDCLIVAGSNPDYSVEHNNIFYLGNLDIDDLLTVYSLSTYFIHLAYLDHCPNVVIDAAASGCHIICSSSGGTKEIAGANCTILKEEPWDFSFIEEKNPPKLDFSKKLLDFPKKTLYNMTQISKQYHSFIGNTINEKNR